MSLRHRKIRPSTSKYRRRKISGVTCFLALFLFSSEVVSACLYRAKASAPPPGALATAHSAEAVNYLLKDGSYVSVVDWHCSRLGKRILLIVPGPDENATKAQRVISQITDKAIRTQLATSLAASSKEIISDNAIEIDEYESVRIAVRRNDYGSQYLVEYYTDD